MSDLKFRAWDGKQMVCPDYITRDGTAHWKADSIPTYSKIIMQSSGMLDKKDKIIYEEDIIVDNDGQRWRIIFSRGQFTAWHPGRWRPLYLFMGQSTPMCEVIGNKYENPRILILRNSQNDMR